MAWLAYPPADSWPCSALYVTTLIRLKRFQSLAFIFKVNAIRFSISSVCINHEFPPGEHPWHDTPSQVASCQLTEVELQCDWINCLVHDIYLEGGMGGGTSKTDISTQWTVKSDLRWKRQIADGGMPTLTLFPAHSFSFWTIMPPRKERRKKKNKAKKSKPRKSRLASAVVFGLQWITSQRKRVNEVIFNFHATTIGGGWGAAGKETGKVEFGKRPHRLATVMITTSC